jgi:hypothetical protein
MSRYDENELGFFGCMFWVLATIILGVPLLVWKASRWWKEKRRTGHV